MRIKQTKIVWVDGLGREHPIAKMSDEYVLNCVCWLQKKITLCDIKSYPVLKDYVKELKADLKPLIQELEERKRKQVKIARKDGCEEN